MQPRFLHTIVPTTLRGAADLVGREGVSPRDVRPRPLPRPLPLPRPVSGGLGGVLLACGWAWPPAALGVCWARSGDLLAPLGLRDRLGDGDRDLSIDMLNLQHVFDFTREHQRCRGHNVVMLEVTGTHARLGTAREVTPAAPLLVAGTPENMK